MLVRGTLELPLAVTRKRGLSVARRTCRRLVVRKVLDDRTFVRRRDGRPGFLSFLRQLEEQDIG